MKTTSKTIHPRRRLSHLRLTMGGLLVVAAAVLAAKSLQPPKPPWQPTVVQLRNVPGSSEGVAVDKATNTIYAGNFDNDLSNNVVAVIDGSKCNEDNRSRCIPIAYFTNVSGSNGDVGPTWLTFDSTTSTLYVTDGLTPSGDEGHTIVVLNTKTCNANNVSGCAQMAAASITTPGSMSNSDTGNIAALAVDTSTHTLYIGDARDSFVAMINTATCNGTTTTDCMPKSTMMAQGDAISIDPSNGTVYSTDANDSLFWVFGGAACNGSNQSGCSQAASFPTTYEPLASAVDPITHTLYVPMPSGIDTLGFVALIDGSTCNSSNTSGCSNPPHLVRAGSLAEQITIDPTTRTAYILSEESSSISLLNIATCNAKNFSGCIDYFPVIAVGINPTINTEINPNTHTLYVTSQDTQVMWVVDITNCNSKHSSGCTKFAPTTTVRNGAEGLAVNPNTETLYEANMNDNTVSVIDTAVCNEDDLAGCNQNWPTISVGNVPRFIGINKVTNTIYVSNREDNTLSIVNGVTCNRTTTSGCLEVATTAVGNVPQQIAVDEATNTIYVENQGDGTVSVINGADCNGTDTSGCNQSWPTVTVGNSPQALGLNPNNHTVYVTNTDDDTVSVIDGNRCNGTNTSGCGQTPATIPVGAGPRAVGILFDKNTVFVGNRDDLTVSVIDGSTCNGTNVSGCPQAPPPAVLVGAFPSTGGNGNNILSRRIAVDQAKRIAYVPIIGDSDVALLDGNACRAGHVNDCHVKIVHERVGGFPIDATVDESSGTVYVSNDTDGTVSFFPSEH
jgi:DNA-binding beta-propeller fold protein YncE